MISKEQLIQTYESNLWLIQRHTEGLDDQDSLHQPQPNINCLNWVLGHMIEGRIRALEFLDKEPIWDAGTRDIYKSGSETLHGPVQHLPLEQLLADAVQTGEQIKAGLESASDEYLNALVDTFRGKIPRWKHLSGLGWHETYHAGQLDLLRQWALGRKNQ